MKRSVNQEVKCTEVFLNVFALRHDSGEVALFCAVGAVLDRRPLEFGENALRCCELLHFSGVYLKIHQQELLDLFVWEGSSFHPTFPFNRLHPQRMDSFPVKSFHISTRVLVLASLGRLPEIRGRNFPSRTVGHYTYLGRSLAPLTRWC